MVANPSIQEAGFEMSLGYGVWPCITHVNLTCIHHIHMHACIRTCPPHTHWHEHTFPLSHSTYRLGAQGLQASVGPIQLGQRKRGDIRIHSDREAERVTPDHCKPILTTLGEISAKPKLNHKVISVHFKNPFQGQSENDSCGFSAALNTITNQ